MCLLAMLYRIWSKLRRPLFSKWDCETAGPWDKAKKGCQLTQCMFEDELEIEMDNEAGLHTLIGLLDMEKFLRQHRP